MSNTLSLEAVKACLTIEQVNPACKAVLLDPKAELLIREEQKQLDYNTNEIAKNLDNEKNCMKKSYRKNYLKGILSKKI